MNVQSGSEPPEPKQPSPAAPRSWALAAGLALVGLGVIAALYVLFAASSKPEEEAGYARFAQGPLSRLAVIEDAPPQPTAELRDAAGNPVTLAAFHGKPTLLNVWATWCAPCVEEMPTLGALKQAYAERGLNVVVVSVDGAGVQDKAKRMLSELSSGALDYYADPAQQLAFAVKAPGMPISILYDAKGHELARVGGAADWSSPEAHALIEAALAGE